MSQTVVKMECPFTWGIDKQLSEKFNEKEEPTIGPDEDPLFAFINSIMITYFRAVQGNNLEALENLEVTDANWKILRNTKMEVEKMTVLQHMMQATEFYVLSLAKRTSANIMLKKLRDSSAIQSPVQTAIINGCKAVAWSCFHENGHAKAAAFAKLAISQDPECPLWHYILSKNLRHARRNDNGSPNPSTAERDAIIKCCQLSNASIYKIHLAQMYRECQMQQKSKEIYLEILATNPKNPGILLRLARSFTAFKDFDKAKRCFDDAGKQPKSPMYWHYYGMFHEKQKNLKMAAECYKKAAENGNLRADLQYANVMSKLLKHKFDVIEHLAKMLNKYDYPAYKQQILLHIGMQYFFRQSNLRIALTYFYQAIEMNPQSELLKDFLSSTVDWKPYDIYDFVSKKVREFNINEESSDEVRSVVQKLRNLCEQHKKQQVAESFEKLKI